MKLLAAFMSTVLAAREPDAVKRLEKITARASELRTFVQSYDRARQKQKHNVDKWVSKLLVDLNKIDTSPCPFPEEEGKFSDEIDTIEDLCDGAGKVPSMMRSYARKFGCVEEFPRKQFLKKLIKRSHKLKNIARRAGRCGEIPEVVTSTIDISTTPTPTSTSTYSTTSTTTTSIKITDKTTIPTTTTTSTTTTATTTTTLSTTTTTTTKAFSCPNDFWNRVYDSENDFWFCTPKAGLASVDCDATSMTVILSTDLLNDDGEYEAKFIDETSMECRSVGSIDDDTLTFTTALDECGTVNSVNGTNLDFIQVLHIENYPSITFTCSYPSLVNSVFGGESDSIAEASNSALNASIIDGRTGFGEFSFDINFFIDEFYTDVASDASFESGEIVYFGINPTGSDTQSSLPATTTFTVTDCRIIHDALSIEFPILSDGCAQHLVGFDFQDTSTWPIDASLRPLHNADSVYFQYMSFEFIAVPENIDFNGDFKLSCDIRVCDRNDASSVCVTAPNCARRRRSSFINLITVE